MAAPDSFGTEPGLRPARIFPLADAPRASAGADRISDRTPGGSEAGTDRERVGARERMQRPLRNAGGPAYQVDSFLWSFHQSRNCRGLVSWVWPVSAWSARRSEAP